MDYVRRNSPFNGIHRRWKFIAVCKEVDDDVKAKNYDAHNPYSPQFVSIQSWSMGL